MALWLKGPERGRRIDTHNIMHSIYRRIIIGWSLRTNVSLQHIYLLLHCRVDCKFARNKKKNMLFRIVSIHLPVLTKDTPNISCYTATKLLEWMNNDCEIIINCGPNATYWWPPTSRANPGTSVHATYTTTHTNWQDAPSFRKVPMEGSHNLIWNTSLR
jgi:hypothetical protein